jgi:RNA polymerase sigma-70 factor (ECF subfamily)
MVAPTSTCWLLIRGAAAGRVRDRDDFARCYEPVIRTFFAARWRDSALREEIDDAAQEVFMECFRGGGALETADPERPHGFRAFLHGVMRNVGLRFERARGRSRERTAGSVSDNAGAIDGGLSPSHALDRAWALALLREAGLVMAARAERFDREGRGGRGAVRRVELLELRFRDDLPIREIARRWSEDPAVVHKEYARAREEFRSALLEVVGAHHPGSAAEVERRCAEILDLVRG